MLLNQLKTTVMIAALMGLLMFIGGLLGGYNGIIVAFIISMIMNGVAYFFSDKIVLASYGAKTLDPEDYAWIYSMVKELAQKKNIPMPKMWIIDTPMANAFATGRNPNNASVAVTTGILKILNEKELRGVLAHEISHVTNRDILISSIAATIASAIGFLANMMQNMAMWGSASNRDNQKGPNVLVMLFVAILMPIAASLIQLSISRSREYLADESGAHTCQDPLALASALEKLNSNIKHDHFASNDTTHAASAHMFIVYPFSGSGLSALFSTHPPVQKRVAILKQMHEDMIKNK